MNSGESASNGAKKPTVAVIVGSTREGRFSETPARWIAERLEARDDVSVRLLDLRDYPMPFFEEAVPPARDDREPYDNEAVNRWTEQIGASDAFIVVAPEYNHGYSAVLKNAFDYVYHGWNRKPIAFVSYGGVSGARAVEQMRLVAIELQMAPIRPALHLPPPVLRAHFTGGDVAAELEGQGERADGVVEDLLWWTQALNAARAGEQ